MAALQDNFILICMGVSGTGKTTLAKYVSDKYGIAYLEADDFHPEENKTHMASGKALTDEMRAPWIKAMCDKIRTLNSPCVLSYSGLRRAHRDQFRALGRSICFLHLIGDFRVIAARMRERVDHFMPDTLLQSQFDAMEGTSEETDVIAISVNGDLSSVYEQATMTIDAFLRKSLS